MDENVTPQESSNSIFLSVKHLIGVPADDTSFDLDITLNINAAISTLYQLGIIKKPYSVTSEKDTYGDLIPEGDEHVINSVKMYLVYKTRLGFDSSTLSSTVISVIKEEISEIEWRLLVSPCMEDSPETEGG